MIFGSCVGLARYDVVLRLAADTGNSVEHSALAGRVEGCLPCTYT